MSIVEPFLQPLKQAGPAIADLAGKEQIESEHISEAIQYRMLDRQFWI